MLSALGSKFCLTNLTAVGNQAFWNCAGMSLNFVFQCLFFFFFFGRENLLPSSTPPPLVKTQSAFI